jgi:hypothetical protein
MTLSFAQRVAVGPDVLFRRVKDEAVLLNLKTEMYLGLDPVATRIWAALEGSPSIQHAYERLLEEYDVEPDVLRRDIEQLLQDLLAHELIRIEGE